VARKIKSKGTRISVLTTDASATLAALRAYEEKRIGGLGFGFLLSIVSSWFDGLPQSDIAMLSNGLIYLAESGSQSATSFPTFEALTMVNLLSDIGEAFINSGITTAGDYVLSSRVVQEKFQKTYVGGLKPSSFKVMNRRNGTVTEVANIDSGKLIVTGEFWFPGGTPLAPKNT
jgi:hypothetical protein